MLFHIYTSKQRKSLVYRVFPCLSSLQSGLPGRFVWETSRGELRSICPAFVLKSERLRWRHLYAGLKSCVYMGLFYVFFFCSDCFVNLARRREVRCNNIFLISCVLINVRTMVVICFPRYFCHFSLFLIIYSTCISHKLHVLF